jgi:hypothetical protein
MAFANYLQYSNILALLELNGGERKATVQEFYGYSAVGINADIGALTGFYNELLKEILKLSMIKPKLSCKII